MKHKFLLAGLMFLFSLSLSAETYSGTFGANLTWTLDTESGVLIISGTGAIKDYMNYSGEYTPWYFYRTSITSAVISDGVTRIGKNAFGDCSGLASVMIPNSVTSIEEYAFNNCSSLTSVVIPNSVTRIEECAFNNCSSLTSVMIGSGVTGVDTYAFSGCSNLASVTVESGNNVYDSRNKCNAIIVTATNTLKIGCKNSVIPNSVTSIGEGAFYDRRPGVITFEGTTPPTVVTFPFFNTALVPAEALYAYKAAWPDYANNIIANNPAVNHQSITVTAKPDKSAIHIAIGDANLESVISLKVSGSINSYDIMIIRNKMINLQELDLTDCDIVANSHEYYTGYHSEDNVLTSHCFDNTPIQKAKLPKSLKQINGYTFNATQLRHLEINGGTLVENAFKSYSLLDTVIVNNATLGQNCFSNSTHLKYVKLNNVNAVLQGAFYGCTQLNTVVMDNVTSIKPSAFYGCTQLNTVVMDDAVTSIGNYAFSGCSALKNITLSNSLTSIGDAAFARCSALKQINLPTSLKTIGKAAFMGAGLTSVTIPASVTDISQFAFAGSSYKEYTIKNVGRKYYIPVTTGDGYIIVNGTKYTLHSSVSSVQPGQYYYLKSFTCYKTKYENGTYYYYTGSSWSSISSSSSDLTYFANIPGQLCAEIINFPNISFGESSWNNYSYYRRSNGKLQSVVFEKGSQVTVFNKSVFDGNESLTSIVFPENLQWISHEALAGCAIDSLVVPETVWMIDYLAFLGATSRYIRLPQTITEIPPYALGYCTNLKEMVIPTNVEKVADYAFYGCTNLEMIKVASSIRNIGNYAFAECPNVEKVYTYTVEPTQIDQNTFSCWKKANLYVPYTSYYTYFYNTQWSQFLRLIEFDEPYDYFYVNNDYELGANGTIDGSPNVDLNPGAGLIITGDNTQTLGDVTQHIDDNYSASIVACEDALTSANLNVRMALNKDYWYFLFLPFDLSLSSVTWPGQYAVYEYDGAARAKNGSGGWKKYAGTTLFAGKGYIVRSSVTGDILIRTANPVFSCETFVQQLPVHAAEAAYDANWTLIGNPFPAYYNMDYLFDAGFKAPVYVYNRKRNDYDVYMPHDDEYHFHPYEAFFVQNPGTTAGVINWTGDGRETYIQSQNIGKNAPARRMEPARSNRRFVELNLRQTEGDDADRTRIVFNPAAEMGYELGTDAVKMQGEGAVRLYSLDTETQYAINERPYDNGYAALGFHVAEEGDYTLSASRLDTAVVIYDNVLQQPVDLTQGGYTFHSKAGTDNTRFGLRLAPQSPTGLQTVQDLFDGKVDVFTLLGVQLYKETDILDIQLPAGVYIFRSNEMTRTVILK